ncbi:hypothetical protein COCNU_04G004110 [Cocos nucifera]|uniref:Uncharacterized protein n=1 Tax=Cocos nucifera TaxID=13894 RepID=A0A8K0MZI1_COCNU|nr:hypothetical protein COCNU_04G004110 [Cocos nucifera]
MNWEDAFSIVLGVIMRKSLYRFQEVGQIAMEFVSLFTSAVRFSGLVYRRPIPVSARYAHLSSMVATY